MAFWLTAEGDYYEAAQASNQGDIEVPERPAEGYRWDAETASWVLPDLWVYAYWLTEDGAYYEGNQASPADRAVPQRPSAEHDWDGQAWVPNLAFVIERRCTEVDALRDSHFDAGMPYQTKVLQLGNLDQQRIIAAGANAKFAVLTSAAWPQDFGWIMADNTLLALDAAGMSALADAAAAQVQAWIFNGYQHKQAIRAMQDAAAIAAYDISTGW